MADAKMASEKKCVAEMLVEDKLRKVTVCVVCPGSSSPENILGVLKKRGIRKWALPEKIKVSGTDLIKIEGRFRGYDHVNGRMCSY